VLVIGKIVLTMLVSAAEINQSWRIGSYRAFLFYYCLLADFYTGLGPGARTLDIFETSIQLLRVPPHEATSAQCNFIFE